MAYQVGIDLGTTSTVAAVCRADGTAHVVPLDGPTGAVASTVYLGADGALLVGEAAERRALSEPGRIVRQLMQRIGDGTPLLVGQEPVPAGELAARFLARLVDDVARHEGGVASRVAVTHPSSWGPHRLGSLRAALAQHGLGSAVLVPEPVAAAASYLAAAHRARGGIVGVYDLGGGRFEASLVRSTAGGFELAGPPEEIGCGGADLDDVVFDHVRTALGAAWEALDVTDPDVLAAVADLRRECTAAKEALSRDTEVLVPVALPGVRTQVRLGRTEFEEMIRPAVAETVEATCRAVDAAATTPAELTAVVLVGGSSRIPLVPQLLGEALGRDVTAAVDPVGAVATGAALLAGGVGSPGAAAGSHGRPVGAPVGRDVGPSGARPGARAGQPGGPAVAAAGAASEMPSRTVAGPGTMPLRPAAAADHAGPGAAPRTGAAGSPADSPFGGTTVLPVARPPKQANPFTAGLPPAPAHPRRIALVTAACVVALAVLGGVVVFGFGRLGAGHEAGAVTPVSVVGPVSASAVPIVTTAEPAPPARAGSPPAGRRARQVPPPAPPAPVTIAPPPTTTVPPPSRAPEISAPEKTVDPTEDGGGNAEPTGDAGAGGTGSDGGAGGPQGDGGGNAPPADQGNAQGADPPAAAAPQAAAGSGSTDGKPAESGAPAAQ